ncbi:hypothetical protein J2T16_004947 [Paenibacillus intestini]|uniref:Uncharacterized protein n=1 Tax=Paenibacillus cucumis (ex Kampfer et al. 2016) TaxID=1776858 RepID=A0ABS7KNF3_9BACL|nr:hypothetical protein [Paenibacillus cucumis (ex Kampfer et al. 2016)]MBY0205704.1 hypothetical protein [Paenibacillus cucumis (ex Kampfer et al. 2016)]MDP9701981.1 hypothetical protein [Paenibacillus intestini]
MKKILRAAFTFTLILNLSIAAVAMASPETTDQHTTEKFIEVQTSGTNKVKVGKFQGDNTIVMDEEGNQFTVGELKAQTNLVLPENPNSNVTPPNIKIQLAPHNDIVKPFASAYGNAWPYSAVTSTKVNCYGYSVKAPFFWNPGDGDGVSNVYDKNFFTDSSVGAALVVKDGNTNGLYFKPGWKILSSRTAAVTADEHRIAYRVGWIDANNNGKVDVGIDVVDFHFMLQNSTGNWSEKHGQQPSINTNISNPSTFSWDLGTYKNFYNSTTAYIAAKVY